MLDWNHTSNNLCHWRYTIHEWPLDFFVGFILGNWLGTHSRAVLRFLVFYNDSAGPDSQWTGDSCHAVHQYNHSQSFVRHIVYRYCINQYRACGLIHHALGEPGSLYLLAASLLYLAGFIVTMAFNVPLNDALAAVDPGSGAGGEVWINYLRRWVPWNHVRTITSLGAMILFVFALRHLP